MTIGTRPLTRAAFGALLIFHSSPVLAQDTGDGQFLGTLVLNSQRDLALDTATAETTLSQDELDRRQASTVAEAVGTIPGVTLTNAATPQGSSINIRGLGADAGTYGSNTKVSVVIDGVAKGQEEIYRQGNLLSIEPELFKQVKVIRGPGRSFRWSSGAIGGTVEAVTKDAADFLEDGDRFAFRQKLAFKSNKNEVLSTSILAFRPDERFDVIAFYGIRKADDYTDGKGDTQKDTAYRLPSGLLKLKYNLTPDLSLTAGISKSENRLTDVSYDIIGSLFGVRVDADLIDTSAYVRMDYAPAGNDLINLKAQFSYSEEEIQNISDVTSSTIYNARQKTVRRSFTLENEAFFDTGAWSHRLLTGLETGTRDRSSRSKFSRGAFSIDGINDTAAPGGTDRFTAVYVTNEMTYGGFTITPQLRYEWQELEGSKDNRFNAGGFFGAPDFQPLPTNGKKYKSEDWAGALSMRYERNGFAVFGTAAYNSNLPILDDLSDRTAPYNYKITEKARTYELGFSYDGTSVLTDEDQLGIKLTGFQTKIWDNTTYSNRNSSEDDVINLEGLELEASYVHPEFYVDLNASKIRGKWGDGSWFNNAPADNFQMTLGKRFFDDQLDVSYEVVHYAGTKRNVQFGGGVTETTAETIHSASLAYKPKSGALAGFDIRFGIDNLTDEHYKPYLSSRPQPGRTVKFSLAKTF